MRCSSYCQSQSYDLAKLCQAYGKYYKIQRFGDVVSFTKGKKSIFCFSYGVVVFWGFKEIEENEFIKKINSYANGFHSSLKDTFEYKLGSLQQMKEDQIILDSKEPLLLQMLAVSYALSQSLKLAVFEGQISQTIEETKHLPQELAEKGSISLSRRSLARKIGALFLERNSVNLHTDILDTPEFFWDHPEYDVLYQMARSDLSIQVRTTVLNTRLDIVRELFEVIREELNNRHSAKLEWIIIILIFIEVALSLLLHVFKVL